MEDSGTLFFEHHTALHDECDLLHHRNVLQRTSFYRDDVSVLAWLQRADIVLHLHQLSAANGGSPQRLRRSHAPLDHSDELPGGAHVPFERAHVLPNAIFTPACSARRKVSSSIFSPGDSCG